MIYSPMRAERINVERETEHAMDQSSDQSAADFAKSFKVSRIRSSVRQRFR